MAAGDVYRITVESTFSLNKWQNSIAFQTLTAPDPSSSDFQALADDVKNLFRVIQTSGVTYTQWTADQLWGPLMTIDAPKCTRSGGRQAAGLLTAPLSGGGSGGDALPPQCAIVTTIVSGLAGRRNRGRVYVSGISEIDQNGGVWIGTMPAAYAASWTTFRNKYGPGGTSPLFRFGIWSERTASGCIPNPTGKGHINVDTPNPDQAFVAASDVVVRLTVFNQRRRTLGVGR